MPMEMRDLRDFVMGYVFGYVALVVALTLIPMIIGQVTNITGVPLLSATLVGTLLAIGVLGLIMKISPF